jgi:hypothetical protein
VLKCVTSGVEIGNGDDVTVGAGDGIGAGDGVVVGDGSGDEVLLIFVDGGPL